jgi:hypothetical protein
MPKSVIIDGVEYQPVVKPEAKPIDPTMGHSPLPWYAHCKIGIANAEGNGLITKTAGDDVLHNWSANCALIIRAVNSHHALADFVKLCASGNASFGTMHNNARILLAELGKS